MQKRFTVDKPNRLHLVDNDVLLTNRWIYNRQLDANKDFARNAFGREDIPSVNPVYSGAEKRLFYYITPYLLYNINRTAIQ